MIELVDTNDRNAVRNMNNIVELHEVMINQRRPEEAVAEFLDPGYIQHDPLLGHWRRRLVEVLRRRPQGAPSCALGGSPHHRSG
jgi:predicted SnoaL-like aldol condensation-catalyzing enzyme